MKNRKCLVCGTEFKYRSSKKYCSIFCKNKAYRENNINGIKEYYSKWYSDNGRNRATDYAEKNIEWGNNNKEKKNASMAVRYALKVNKIVKPNNCQICGEEKRLHGHHKDYTKKLDVIWVCQSCHKKIHSGRISISYPLDKQ